MNELLEGAFLPPRLQPMDARVAEALVAVARKAEVAAQHGAAEWILLHVAECGHRTPAVLIALARAAAGQFKHQRALDLALSAAELDPWCASAWDVVSAQRAKLGLWGDALDALKYHCARARVRECCLTMVHVSKWSALEPLSAPAQARIKEVQAFVKPSVPAAAAPQPTVANRSANSKSGGASCVRGLFAECLTLLAAREAKIVLQRQTEREQRATQVRRSPVPGHWYLNRQTGCVAAHA